MNNLLSFDNLLIHKGCDWIYQGVPYWYVLDDGGSVVNSESELRDLIFKGALIPIDQL